MTIAEWLSEANRQPMKTTAASLILSLLLIPLLTYTYNLLLHPLSHFPGPLTFRASRLRNNFAAWSGRYPYILRSLHAQYGPIVRVAPDELSIAHPSAWDDIYSNVSGANEASFPKSEIWHGELGVGDKATSIFTTRGKREHARARRALDPAFSERAVMGQEEVVRGYVDLMVGKIWERMGSGGGGDGKERAQTVVNVVEWFNFVMFDIIGDLAFGTPFSNLATTSLEPWQSTLGDSIKAAYFLTSLRHYPLLFNILWRLLPKSLIKAQEEHHRNAVLKVRARLASQIGEKADIVSLMLQEDMREGDGEGNGKKKEGLSFDELVENSKLFIIAGSETTVTVLSGVVNHLVWNRRVWRALTEEVRGAFASVEEMTLAELKKLEYLDGCLREGLRLCNPILMGHMRITPPEGGIVAGHFIPGNTLIHADPLTLSTSPSHFHKPLVFAPERWLSSSSHLAPTPNSYANDDLRTIRTFGTGPQSCIGEPLAWAEMRMVLGRLVWEFDLELPAGPKGEGQEEDKADEETGQRKWEEQDVWAVVNKRDLWVRLVARES